LIAQAKAQSDQAIAAHQAQAQQQKAQNDAIHLQVKTQSEIALARIKAELDAKMAVLDAHLKATAEAQKVQRPHPPLVPVDYDPFSADSPIPQAQTQQESQPQPLAKGSGQPNVGAPANNAQAAPADASYNPNSANGGGSYGSRMPDYSLVPVDYQPDFGNYSLVPVDYDPFSADGPIQQAQIQTQSPQIPAQSPPQEPATGAGQPNVDAPIDWSRYNRPFGELKPATYTPTQRIGNVVSDALMGLGMQPYTANDLTSRVGKVLGLSPLGIGGSTLDLIDAKRRDDFPGAVMAAAGMIPGAKGVAQGVAADAIHLHHAWPKYLGWRG
jgi:hypothetical protein